MSTLDEWAAAACAELGVDPAAVAVKTVLDLARDAAHEVERPAAPLTAFILGLAVGHGQAVDQAARQLSTLARNWPKADGPGDQAGR